jgi:hypothetical protein
MARAMVVGPRYFNLHDHFVGFVGFVGAWSGQN